MPDIEALAEEFEGKVRFVVVEIDEEQAVMERFSAEGLPTYLVFDGGREVDRMRLVFVDWFLKPRIRRMLNGALD